MSGRAPLLCLTLVLSAAIPPGYAALNTETDQFTTPEAPLHDIGPALSRKIVEIIESDRTGAPPEHILSNRVGRSIVASRLTHWVNGIRNTPAPVSFRPSVFGSIYRTTLSPMPVSFWFDAPTVYIHGYYLGTDKIDHFFRQGHDYYRVVMRKKAWGVDPAAAIEAAVAHGVKQEHSYFGTLFSGVYSNSDLAANYAGMKFYLNLSQTVQIGDRVLPPMFERSASGWRLRPGVDAGRLLEPFLSNHLNESLNPSRYRFSRGSIRARIRDRCESWTRFYADRLALVAPSGQSFARNWFGEKYGHWLPPADEVSIATECGVVNMESGRLVLAQSKPARRNPRSNPAIRRRSRSQARHSD